MCVCVCVCVYVCDYGQEVNTDYVYGNIFREKKWTKLFPYRVQFWITSSTILKHHL